MKMEPINKLFMFCIILYGCGNAEETEATKVGVIDQGKYAQVTNKWQQDSLGCLGMRSLDLAQKMISENGLLDKPLDEFTKYFGKPNEVVQKEERTYVDYYIEARCKEGGIINEEADKCWIQFIFKRNRLEKIPEVFACE